MCIEFIYLWRHLYWDYYDKINQNISHYRRIILVKMKCGPIDFFLSFSACQDNWLFKEIKKKVLFKAISFISNNKDAFTSRPYSILYTHVLWWIEGLVLLLSPRSRDFYCSIEKTLSTLLELERTLQSTRVDLDKNTQTLK